MTLMYGTSVARRRSTAAIVLASCMSDSVPSCIRAPPDAETTTRGMRSACAASAARATFSPTTAPIEPPMNPKSMTQMEIRRPSIRPVPQTAASRRPVATWAAVIRSGYGFWSTKPSASTEIRPASRSSKVPASRSSSRRAGADNRKWCPQVGQTRRFFSSCLLNSISSHDGHFVHRSGGYESRRERNDGSLIGIAGLLRVLAGRWTGHPRIVGQSEPGPWVAGCPTEAPGHEGRAGQRDRGRGDRAADEHRPGHA